MNPNSYFKGAFVLIAALAYTLFASDVEARDRSYGHLVVQRSANFGTYVTLQLWIDGVEMRNISRGRRYNRPIPVGHHVLTVTTVPNTRNAPPTSTLLAVRPGELYVFTALWNEDWGNVVLQPATLVL